MPETPEVADGQNGEPGKPKPRSKKLTVDEQEALIEFAVNVLPLAIRPYQTVSEIMRESGKYGATREPITRRVANRLMQRAAARLRSEVQQIVPGMHDHTIWKLRELYAAARKKGQFKTCAYLLQIEDRISSRGAGDNPLDESPVGVDFTIYDPGPATSGDPAGGPTAEGADQPEAG